MFCLPHPNVIRHRTPLGVTLIEVMMSTMVVSLGILGLVALIPLGTHLTERGVRADRIASLGPRAFHEARARGVFNPNNWVTQTTTPSGEQALQFMTFRTDSRPSMLVRQPYLIDPTFFGGTAVHPSRRKFPYPETFARKDSSTTPDGYSDVNMTTTWNGTTKINGADATSSKLIQMWRLGLQRTPGTGLSLPQAKYAFQSNDDLAFERPEDGELAPFQRFYDRSGSSVRRQAMGEYSWMVMLVPETTETFECRGPSNNILSIAFENWLNPPINYNALNTGAGLDANARAQLQSIIDAKATDEYTAHVIIMRNRLGLIPDGDSTSTPVGEVDGEDTADPESLEYSNERVLRVTQFFSTGGYSTGEVTIFQEGGTLKQAEEQTLKISNGDWICLARRLPSRREQLATMAPFPPKSNTRYPRGDIYQWYKVVMVDDVEASGSNFTRRLTISGPDWPFVTTDADDIGSFSTIPTHAIIVDGVVGVYSKRVRLETQSPWSP
ncbi:hypothetical protein C5Y96_17860 [Blastopirellula marina]|uniref:Uncharacterized protein n=1 Tax=Blastopirellula marina TaxID=124 RepID=A0A2S8F5G3_9BACT|nr:MULTISPECIES: hypothetical protein [Pirellulaceae]PQO27405.1 hypothetical protein C5Y96_17860 [Blastopirellula marina]RCS47942.1 hypothetical protein DTL36_17885 [Bremerella cremea]